MRGADKITILEDKDGDGRFESHKDFVTGLNIASSVAVGRGGVFVLNPPYLLFYPDATRTMSPTAIPKSAFPALASKILTPWQTVSAGT